MSTQPVPPHTVLQWMLQQHRMKARPLWGACMFNRCLASNHPPHRSPRPHHAYPPLLRPMACIPRCRNPQHASTWSCMWQHSWVPFTAVDVCTGMCHWHPSRVWVHMSTWGPMPGGMFGSHVMGVVCQLWLTSTHRRCPKGGTLQHTSSQLSKPLMQAV